MLRLKNLYLAVFCVLVVLCRATSAKADALDYTLMSSGNTISFQLPSQTPTPTGCTLVFGCNGSFGFINLPVTFKRFNLLEW